jgi:hypothetical protein
MILQARQVATFCGSLLVVGAASFLGPARQDVRPNANRPASSSSVLEGAAAVDAAIERHWPVDTAPAPAADDLQVARRLSLALVGSIPSLEDIRWIESQAPAGRLAAWTERLLADDRFSNYFAERLARALVHSDGNDFPFPFRRDRFVAWLGDELRANRPYDELVRNIVAAEGLWTDEPAANYYTAHVVDPIGLTTRSTRVFLGLRLDCAQCHDHPFALWKQTDFSGLAAYFGGTRLSEYRFGVHDVECDYVFDDARRKDKQVVQPRLPFAPELDPGEGPRRRRLAEWMTHPDNPYFAKALVNRIWAILFGVGLVEPIDDLDRPETLPGVLDAAAAEFRRENCDLRHLIRVLAGTSAFRRQSAAHGSYDITSETRYQSFPLTRLRCDQVAGAVLQMSMLRTLDNGASLAARAGRYGDHWDLSDAYGDKREEEMASRACGLTSRLVLMNNPIVERRVSSPWFAATHRLNWLSSSPEQLVEAAFLVCLTRRADEEEQRHFATSLSAAPSAQARLERVQDLVWSLVNSTEFCWQH